MQKKLQNKLGLKFSEDIIDIVQFGSSIQLESEPNDIDIAVIFKSIPLKNQLEESQKIKKQLEKHFSKPIHINSYDFYNLFNEGNFAKESILFYGKSLLSGDYFSKTLGIAPRIHIHYSLEDLEKKDKVRFNYLLNGKKGNYGLLREYGGKLLNPGLIEIKPEHEKIFTEALQKITKNIIVKIVFLQVV